MCYCGCKYESCWLDSEGECNLPIWNPYFVYPEDADCMREQEPPTEEPESAYPLALNPDIEPY